MPGRSKAFANGTIDFVTDYPTQYGVITVLKFRDVEGNIIVWKASGAAPERSDVGKKYSLAGRLPWSGPNHGHALQDRRSGLARARAPKESPPLRQVRALLVRAWARYESTGGVYRAENMGLLPVGDGRALRGLLGVATRGP